jgi:hypothetical protein
VWTVRTVSGRGPRNIEHLGSAHDEAELEALKAAAQQRLAAGQPQLDLGLDVAAASGPLQIASSGMGIWGLAWLKIAGFGNGALCPGGCSGAGGLGFAP